MAARQRLPLPAKERSRLVLPVRLRRVIARLIARSRDDLSGAVDGVALGLWACHAVEVDAELLDIKLEELEWEILRAGLREWGGPARCTEEIAVAMGFSGLDGFWMERDRLSKALAAKEALSRIDWARVSIATELVFISDLVGSGSDWQYTVGVDDTSTIEIGRASCRERVCQYV